MSNVGDARDRPAGNVVLNVSGWLWCVVMAIVAVSLMFTGGVLAALVHGVSAFLAAPPSWRVLARYGIKAPRPFKAAAVVGTWIVGAVIAAATNTPASEGRPAKDITGRPAAASSTEGPTTCEGIKSAPRDFAVLERGPLRERADPQSEQVSMPFGVDQEVRPVSIDTTMPLRELCRSGKWSYVAILQLPSDIGQAKGWVPTADLRPVNTDKSGRRIYGPADFEWPDGSLRYQKAILTVVNRVMAENPRCDAFNSQSILMDKDRAGPLIKVACFGEPEQIVDFRPDDATNGRSFAPVDPIDETTAREACWSAAKERATHPSTVDISTFGGQFNSDESGSASYRTTFTAKNAFNLSLNFTISCSFKGNEFMGVEIQETVK